MCGLLRKMALLSRFITPELIRDVVKAIVATLPSQLWWAHANPSKDNRGYKAFLPLILIVIGLAIYHLVLVPVLPK